MVFDVDDVLLDNRREFFITAYNVYSGLSAPYLVSVYDDVPRDFIEAYKKVERWSAKIGHRLACHWCLDHGVVPKSREEFDRIVSRFGPEEIAAVVDAVGRVRDELRSEPGWYEDTVRPFPFMVDLVADLASAGYALYTATANRRSLPMVRQHYPNIGEDRLLFQESGPKSEIIVGIVDRGITPERVSFIDDNFINVVDVVETSGLSAVNGFVNDWGGKFARPDLLAEPMLAARPSIRVVGPEDFRSALLPAS